jgi:hypothetical protein
MSNYGNLVENVLRQTRNETGRLLDQIQKLLQTSHSVYYDLQLVTNALRHIRDMQESGPAQLVLQTQIERLENNMTLLRDANRQSICPTYVII